MPEDRGIMRPDDTTGVKDEDFVVESFSVKGAFDPPPNDTTEAVLAAEILAEKIPARVAEPGIEGEDEPTPEVDATAVVDEDGHVSESRLSKAEAAVAVVETPKPKNKVSASKRTADLKREIDTLTFQRRDAERHLAELKRQIEATPRPEGVPAKPPLAAVAETTDKPILMPRVPKYRDFDTDEAYETAMATYHTELSAAIGDQQTRLERRITEGLEARFRSAGDHAAIEAAERQLVSTLEKVRSGKPDWDVRAGALKDLRSPWYNPDVHHDATAPFLSDLSISRLSMGLEDGGELLYWLGEDVDRAHVLADLFPTRPLRDAIVAAPSVIPLLEHFATDEGQREFEALKRMQDPHRVDQAIGALSVRLAGASRGSPAGTHSITKAHPSARPPVGTPGAQDTTIPTGKPPTFENWMRAEDERELRERKRAAGIAV